MKHDYNDILQFWFEELEPKQWYVKDEELDAMILKRFGEVHAHAAKGETSEWREVPEGRLAEIIVLDQFSRNMFRGTKESFAYDDLALECAKEAIEVGADTQLTEKQRGFMYLPFMHSERPEDHERAMELYADHPNLEYEIKHKEFIDRFGRYPFRNDILGRESTPEEIEFLKTNPGF